MQRLNTARHYIGKHLTSQAHTSQSLVLNNLDVFSQSYNNPLGSNKRNKILKYNGGAGTHTSILGFGWITVLFAVGAIMVTFRVDCVFGTFRDIFGYLGAGEGVSHPLQHPHD
jgi:hypothetical protein